MSEGSFFESRKAPAAFKKLCDRFSGGFLKKKEKGMGNNRERLIYSLRSCIARPQCTTV